MHMRRAPTRIVTVADGTTPAIKAGTTAVFTTTTTTFEFRWLQERSSDCAALHSSQNLAIGKRFCSAVHVGFMRV